MGTWTRRALLGVGAATAASCSVGGPDPRTTEPAARVLRYGDDPSQVAELTRPDGDAPVPVAVLVHGGFWRAAYGAEYARPLVPSLHARGWASLVVEYRRVGNGGGYPATLDDVAAAVDLLADETSAPGAPLDLGTVIAVGHSAGGHLAAWLATRAGQRPGAPGAAPRVPVTAVVAQAGVLDLATAADDGVGGSAVPDLLGGRPADAPDAYDVADPSGRLPLGVPVLCVHGSADDIVPLSQSTEFVERAGAAGDDAELREVPGDHFAVIDPDDASWAATLDWMDQHR